MIRHLELPSSLTTQRAILLEKLPEWNKSQLEKTLLSLAKKGIAVLTSISPTVRTISLERPSVIPTLDENEKKLWFLLITLILQ